MYYIGGSALSTFRLNKLLIQAQEFVPNLSRLEAQYLMANEIRTISLNNSCYRIKK